MPAKTTPAAPGSAAATTPATKKPAPKAAAGEAAAPAKKPAAPKAGSTASPKAKPSASGFSTEAIAAKAWEIFQQRQLEGRPGDPDSDWYEALGQLQNTK